MRAAKRFLAELLESQGVTHIAVLGLATDYCVKYTALDALSAGFATTLIIDGCRGVELQPGDCEGALAEMQSAGARLMTSEQWLAEQA